MLNTFGQIILLGSFLGCMTPFIFNLVGVYTGQEAIEYYAEVHQSKWNSFIHTIGMPFTYYGLLLCVPPIFCRTKRNIARLQLFFYPYFISYYLYLNFWVGLIVAICYFPSQERAMFRMNISKNKLTTAIYGMMVATTALTFQEVFGHWLGGDPPSRLEAIPNAIWHAGFYSVWHLLN